MPLRRLLCSLERLREDAIWRALRKVKTCGSRSSALLCRVTFLDQWLRSERTLPMAQPLRNAAFTGPLSQLALSVCSGVCGGGFFTLRHIGSRARFESVARNVPRFRAEVAQDLFRIACVGDDLPIFHMGVVLANEPLLCIP